MGAAIAAGSQLENGIWALFVIAASTTNTLVHMGKSLFHVFVISQCPSLNIKAIVIRSMTSPIRFVSAVIMPAPRLLGLL